MITTSVGVLLTAVLESSAAPAQPAVRWDAPPECGSAHALEDRVTQQLGTLEPGIAIFGRVWRDDGLYALELELVVGAEHQRRSFSAVDCHTLLEAAVLISSAALGPERTPISAPQPPPAVPEPNPAPPEPEPTPPPEPEPAPPPPLVKPEPLPSPPEPAPPSFREQPAPAPTPDALPSPPRRPRRGHWLISSRLGAGYDGTLVAPGGSLGIGHAWRRWRVQAQLDGLGGRTQGTHGGLALGVVAVDPRACAIVRPRTRIELLPCAGVAAGLAVGQGRDVPNARSAVVPWATAHLDGGLLVIPRRWLALGIELSGYAMLARPRFVLSDQRTVYRVGPAGGQAFLTVELRIPATDRAVRGH